MCGILAVAGKSGKEEVAKLSARMRHRGPDERDIVCSSVGVLSHERLSIIDLTTGKQPIKGNRNTYVIHNGEIYNYKLLYQNILSDVKPRTTSDSEVIVHLYEKYGHDFCNYLDGMFAFVVFDEDRSTYVAGRDPIGVKPMYWGSDKAGRKWFASEMKALHDVVETVEVFPPGHFYTPETGLQKYYFPKWEKLHPEKNDYNVLREKLEQAVEKRLVSDVPFGVLLSGGLDSSLIASIVARKLKAKGKKVHSFSVGLSPDAPDLKAAREVAKFIGTEHHEVYFTIEDGIRNAEKMIWHLESYDVTTFRASTPMYYLSRYISNMGIKMVLSGEGADEIFGGYLYFHNAPSNEEFHEETKRRIKLLYSADLLRADKSTMAWGIEARVPMLDKAFLEEALTLNPEIKRPYKNTVTGEKRIEKWVLRKAFDDKINPYLPDSILWRQKEQFGDGVGYSWIDSFKAYCENVISDKEFAEAEKLFPYNTPDTKEAFYIRKLFAKSFPEESCAKTVLKWIPKWQTNTDPSGRANSTHSQSYEEIPIVY